MPRRTARYLHVRSPDTVAGPAPPGRRSQVLPVEDISYTYETTADPRCRHHIALSWDRNGGATHEVVVDYARRDVDTPFPDDEYANTCWQASHDSAQSSYYVTESRTQSIHREDPEGWRLQVPWRARNNALVIPAAMLSQDRECRAAAENP